MARTTSAVDGSRLRVVANAIGTVMVTLLRVLGLICFESGGRSAKEAGRKLKCKQWWESDLLSI
jgi:hypothetical protein